METPQYNHIEEVNKLIARFKDAVSVSRAAVLSAARWQMIGATETEVKAATAEASFELRIKGVIVR